MTVAVIYIAPWKAMAALCVLCLAAGVRDDIANASAFVCGLREWWTGRRSRRRGARRQRALAAARMAELKTLRTRRYDGREAA